MAVSPDMKRARYECCTRTCKAIIADLRQLDPVCAANPVSWPLNDQLVSGPAANCPEGLWEALDPVTVEQAGVDSRDAYRAHITSFLLRGLRPLIRGLIVANGGVEGATGILLTALLQYRGGVELWMMMTVVTEMQAEALVTDLDRFTLLSACVGELQGVEWGGNDLAYYNLRCCVEAGACTQEQAEAVASAWLIQEPVNV